MRYLCKSPRHDETMVTSSYSYEGAALVFANLCRITDDTVTVRQEGSPYEVKFRVKASVSYDIVEV